MLMSGMAHSGDVKAHIHAAIRTYTSTRTHTYAHIQAHILTYTHRYKPHTYTHIQTHTNTYKHTYAHIHAATCKNGRQGLVFLVLGWVGLLVYIQYNICKLDSSSSWLFSADRPLPV